VKFTKWHSIRKTTSGLGFDLQVLADALNQHIPILAAILLKGSQPKVGRRNSAWVALGGVTIYTELVGAEASVVKAAVMAALFIFATPLLRGIHWAGLLSPRPPCSSFAGVGLPDRLLLRDLRLCPMLEHS
jgi:hypothetical protein